MDDTIETAAPRSSAVRLVNNEALAGRSAARCCAAAVDHQRSVIAAIRVMEAGRMQHRQPRAAEAMREGKEHGDGRRLADAASRPSAL